MKGALTRILSPPSRGAVTPYAAGADFKHWATKAALEQFIKRQSHVAEVAQIIAERPRNSLKYPKMALGAMLFSANEKQTLDEEDKTFYHSLICGRTSVDGVAVVAKAAEVTGRRLV